MKLFSRPRRRARCLFLALAAVALPTTPVSAAPPRTLHAGPTRLTFADGELRYLYVGQKEVVRRVYFAVRAANWDTIMPRFTHIQVQDRGNGFTVALSAVCRRDPIRYRWQGRIVGTPDGQITFRATGTADSAFPSNRIGLCVLYGAPSLAGQAFRVVHDDGTATDAAFPPLVAPALVAPRFRALTYRTADGLSVAGSIAGAVFDMEDQRNYGDSSFKAYAPLPYPYPNVASGATLEQTFTLRVTSAPPAAPVPTMTRVIVGALLPDARIPRLSVAPPDAHGIVFGDINFNRARYTGASSLTWGLTPSIHLPDEDVFRENRVTVVDQARTAHVFAPGAAIHVDPVTLGPGDGRNGSPFGRAWAAAVLKYLSLAGVADARVVPPLPAALVALTGHALYATTVTGPGPAPVDALAVDDAGTPRLWLINLTGRPQPVTVTVSGLRGSHQLTRRLGPYQVVEVNPPPG